MRASSGLFPTDLPEREWRTFPAAGFADPAVGLIYRNGGGVPYVGFGNPDITEMHERHWPLIRECGVPLGGLGTGYATLRLDGRFGSWSLYNNLANSDTAEMVVWAPEPVPQARDVDLPFLGLSIGGQSHVLSLGGLDGVDGAEQIHYWGHYPVADLEYELDAPVAVGLRAWAPFIPGDAASSNVPGAVFEVRLRNTSGVRQSGTIAFSFPGPDAHETLGAGEFERETVDGAFGGVTATTFREGWPGPDPDTAFPPGYPTSGAWVPYGYALGAIGRSDVRIGAALGTDGAAWASVHERLPEARPGDPGNTVAVDFSVEPGQTEVVRFVLAWYAPFWPQARYVNMYHARFRSALEVATFLANEHETLLRRVLAWQGSIYSEEEVPECLRDAMVNILYLMTKGSSYTCVPGAKLGEGLFAITEAARAMPMREVVCQAAWGDFPITYFFPDVRLGTLRATAAYQLDDGRIPMYLGIDELDVPAYAQALANGYLFVEMVARVWQRTGDDAIAREFYPTVKRAMQFHMTKSVYDDGLIGYDPVEAPRGCPYDSWDWRGNAAYTAGHWLCALRVAERMAGTVGDIGFAEECRDWIARGSRAMEQTLWNEETGSYDVYNAPGTELRSDTVFSYQLEGSFNGALLGLPEVFPADRLATTLDTIERLCVRPISVGAANAMRPDGTPDSTGSVDSEGIFPSHNAMLAAEYAYNGRRALAVEIMEQALRNLVIDHLFAWDFPQGFFEQDGVVPRGSDDHFGMAIWSVPPALFGQTIREFCSPGGLGYRILEAARTGDSERTR